MVTIPDGVVFSLCAAFALILEMVSLFLMGAHREIRLDCDCMGIEINEIYRNGYRLPSELKIV